MIDLDALIVSGVRSQLDQEDLWDYLERLGLLGKGFGYRELVKSSRRHGMPPRKLWSRLAMTLAAAIEFRRRAICEAGVEGLRVAAAYRPRGGASRSAHKTASALDLDRIGGDGEAYFRCAVRFWSEYGRQLGMGLGLYTWSSKSTGGLRVHIDTNNTCRTWQGVRAGFMRPWAVAGWRSKQPLSRKLLADMGLQDPTR